MGIFKPHFVQGSDEDHRWWGFGAGKRNFILKTNQAEAGNSPGSTAASSQAPASLLGQGASQSPVWSRGRDSFLSVRRVSISICRQNHASRFLRFLICKAVVVRIKNQQKTQTPYFGPFLATRHDVSTPHLPQGEVKELSLSLAAWRNWSTPPRSEGWSQTQSWSFQTAKSRLSLLSLALL